MAAVQGTYHAISDYGAIGNTRTLALVGKDGSIDWLCWPRFDSPSVFGALLDSRKGGRFQVCPDGPYTSCQRYIEDTNVLVTTFQMPTGTLQLTDFMACGEDQQGEVRRENRLFRVARCTEGEVPLRVRYQPRPNYGGDAEYIRLAEKAISLVAGSAPMVLESSVPLFVQDDLAEASLSLRAGEIAAFTLSDGVGLSPQEWGTSLQETTAFWQRWAVRCSYEGPWRKALVRSALALKLLIYSPTGAVVAAPTTSLPEQVGGARNWDYRYAWLRDAGMTLNALFSLGYSREAERYGDWVLRTLQGCQCGVDLKVMYNIDGGCLLHEEELDRLEGYRGSKPVRVGNAAHTQEQLDVYGEVLDCLAVCRVFGKAREPGAWSAIIRLVEHVVQYWNKPDSGIWEVRSKPQHFTYSKVMAWVALDRAIRASEQFRLRADLPRWRRERERIKVDILEKGVAGDPAALVRAYDDPIPDAANLLVVGTGFLPLDHPLLAATVDSVLRNLGRDALVYRYLGDDGLPGQEGAFLPCSFWLVEALARTGRVSEAAEMFEEVLSCANRLGLLPEEIDPDTKEYLGNYPQALSHIAVINAALALEVAEAKEPNPNLTTPRQL